MDRIETKNFQFFVNEKEHYSCKKIYNRKLLGYYKVLPAKNYRSRVL